MFRASLKGWTSKDESYFRCHVRIMYGGLVGERNLTNFHPPGYIKDGQADEVGGEESEDQGVWGVSHECGAS